MVVGCVPQKSEAKQDLQLVPKRSLVSTHPLHVWLPSSEAISHPSTLEAEAREHQVLSYPGLW